MGIDVSAGFAKVYLIARGAREYGILVTIAELRGRVRFALLLRIKPPSGGFSLLHSFHRSARIGQHHHAQGVNRAGLEHLGAEWWARVNTRKATQWT